MTSLLRRLPPFIARQSSDRRACSIEDSHAITTLFKTSKRMPHIFAPLGNKHYFAYLGIPKTHFHTLDWW
ncbi:hypothetical protein CPB85DRAFT_852088 [Mucidula mucida]|nr:hypothetical protein CPB85DRAFT_852088 [Mucidula mucida]